MLSFFTAYGVSGVHLLVSKLMTLCEVRVQFHQIQVSGYDEKVKTM